MKSGHFLLSSEWVIFPVLSQNWEKRRFQSTTVIPRTTSCIFLQGKGFWPCSQGYMTEDSNLVRLLTSCSSNWRTSCVIRTGLLWLEIPQSLSHQRLLEDVILAKVLQMVFSKVFFLLVCFLFKKVFGRAPRFVGSQFPNQWSNSCLPYCKLWVWNPQSAFSFGKNCKYWNLLNHFFIRDNSFNFLLGLCKQSF